MVRRVGGERRTRVAGIATFGMRRAGGVHPFFGSHGSSTMRGGCRSRSMASILSRRKPGLCSGPRASERETSLVEDSRGAWVGPTGESPAAARAAVGAFVEGTIAEGSTRTERNRTLERPGAWALLGRAEDDTWTEPEAKEAAGTLDELAASRGAAR